MNREQIPYQENDLSDASADHIEQVAEASQDSIFVVPDLEEQNSRSSVLEDYYTESSSEQIPECYQIYNTKDTGTSPIESRSSFGSPHDSNTLVKKVGANFYLCNEVAKTHEETPFRFHVDLPSVLNDEQLIEEEDNSVIRYTLNEYGLYNAENLTTHKCNNSKKNIDDSSKKDYFSSCFTKKQEDKEFPECQGKSNESEAGQSKTTKKPNSAINVGPKQASVSNVSKNQSKDSIKCSGKQNKKKSDGGSACSIDKSKPCCPNVHNTPPCPSIPIKQPDKYPPSTCCQILENFKESGSLSAFHRCTSQSSTNQNSTPSSTCDHKVDCESIKKRPKTADEKKAQCKKSTSNCSNLLIIEGSETQNEKGLSVIQLDKRASNLILKNLENNSQSVDESVRYADMIIPGSPGMLTDSHRNFETYFGFHDHSSRKMCMKVKVIPSKTNAVEDVVSLIKMTIDQDETIPTCKITSGDLTSIAKDFFGTIYKRTKDAMTIISSESARLLDLVMRTSTSVNTDESSIDKKICDDKSVDALSQTQMFFNVPDGKTSADVGSMTVVSLESLEKSCGCTESVKSTQQTNAVSQSLPNSVFTTIKTKLCSIFREDCDLVNFGLRQKDSESSEESEQILNKSDSDESLIKDVSLRKAL